MSAHKPPLRVWVCWCTACGRVDYAYEEKPEESGADCPGCEVDRSYKKIAGPYELVEQGVRLHGRPAGGSWTRGPAESNYSIGTILDATGEGVIAEVFCGDDSDEENRAGSEADFTLLLAAPSMAGLLKRFVTACDSDLALSLPVDEARDVLGALGRLP